MEEKAKERHHCSELLSDTLAGFSPRTFSPVKGGNGRKNQSWSACNPGDKQVMLKGAQQLHVKP